MRVFVIAIGLIGALALFWTARNVVIASGAFSELKPMLADACTSVEIAPGTEDIVIDRDLGAAFVAAAERRAWFNSAQEGGFDPRNGIYLASIDGSDSVRRVSPPMENFLPHGIGLWRGALGQKRLFVVNHAADDVEAVEIFDVDAVGDLTHLASISFPAMRSPNDVIPVGPRSFYVTNDRRFKSGLLSVMESYLALPLASVAYYDGINGRIVAGGLTYANGVNISADRSTLYVSEVLGRRISIYERNKAIGGLKKIKSIPVSSGVDNIDVGPEGDLWVAGHPKIFKFLEHAQSPLAIAPSQAFRVDPKSGEVEQVFVSVNGEINASSVAARYDNGILIGAVFDDHILRCPLGE